MFLKPINCKRTSIIFWSNPTRSLSDILKYLHPLFAAGDVVDVYVQHIKYTVYFFKIGFDPKIFIKRRGEWETQVVGIKSMSVR